MRKCLQINFGLGKGLSPFSISAFAVILGGACGGGSQFICVNNSCWSFSGGV
jgi:hypothetical protein